MAELKLYAPLLVHLNDPGMAWNSLNELEEENGAFHTDIIAEAVKNSMEVYGDRGLAVKMEGLMGEKIISAMPSVEEHNGALYGTITFVSAEELDGPHDRQLADTGFCHDVRNSVLLMIQEAAQQEELAFLLRLLLFSFYITVEYLFTKV